VASSRSVICPIVGPTGVIRESILMTCRSADSSFGGPTLLDVVGSLPCCIRRCKRSHKSARTSYSALSQVRSK
jgi:hypothetical protein